jgi:hypothetical protein
MKTIEEETVWVAVIIIHNILWKIKHMNCHWEPQFLKSNIKKSMLNIIIFKSSKLSYHKVMEFFHQGIQPKVCPALSEVVLAHSTNHNSSLGQLFQRCWYSLHLRCQLQPTANFLQHLKKCY